MSGLELYFKIYTEQEANCLSKIHQTCNYNFFNQKVKGLTFIFFHKMFPLLAIMQEYISISVKILQHHIRGLQERFCVIPAVKGVSCYCSGILTEDNKVNLISSDFQKII